MWSKKNKYIIGVKRHRNYAKVGNKGIQGAINENIVIIITNSIFEGPNEVDASSLSFFQTMQIIAGPTTGDCAAVVCPLLIIISKFTLRHSQGLFTYYIHSLGPALCVFFLKFTRAEQPNYLLTKLMQNMCPHSHTFTKNIANTHRLHDVLLFFKHR